MKSVKLYTVFFFLKLCTRNNSKVKSIPRKRGAIRSLTIVFVNWIKDISEIKKNMGPRNIKYQIFKK